MKITILTDNHPGCGLCGEWGFSAFIEYQDTKVLLDTGASDLFLRNASMLGCDIEDVDYGVLSHAHYDHANGIPSFFMHNKKAAFYVQASTSDNIYTKKLLFRKYIGIPKNLMTQYVERIIKVEGQAELSEGITLLGHNSKNLSLIGKREHMVRKWGKNWRYDDFSHEQSLIFKTADGLVVLNSCSHGGVINIVNEVKKAFPSQRILALIGGFHLYNKTRNENIALAHKIAETDVSHIITGHCTEENGFFDLREVLGERVQKFHVGLVLEYK